MLEQQDRSVIFYAHFILIADGTSATGLTVTLDVWEVQRDGTATEIVTAGSATEIGDGLYRYLLAAGSVDEPAEYIAVFKAAGTTVVQNHIPALWVIDRGAVDPVIENSKSMFEMMRIMYAALAGIASGGGTTEVTFRDDADSKDRIVATVDEDGNRSAVVLDGS